MDALLKETVRRRAGFRSEYCHLPEAIAELPFQFNHVIAGQHPAVWLPKTTSHWRVRDAIVTKDATYQV
jgi:hypothetical protein